MSDYPQTRPAKSKPHAGVFQRTLIREFVSNGVLVSTVLLGIVLVSQLIRFLNDAVSGKVAVDGILALLGFAAINYLPILLSIALFISVLLTLSRCYRDSEMVVWQCAGIGLLHWIRPVLMYALPVAGLIGLLSLVLSPWALSQADELKRKLESRDDVATASTGVFRESRQADRVYFIENVNLDSNQVSNVFVQAVRHGKQNVMYASRGFQETQANGDRFLVLLNGTRYEGVPGQLDYNIVEFERYAVRIDSVPAKTSEPRAKAMSTLDLLNNPSSWNISELGWRIGVPISAIVLVLLAIPLSYVNPRAGRSLNLILAIVLYVIYNNLMSMSNTWVGQGKVAPILGLSWVHVLMALVVLFMFYKRMTLFSMNRLKARWGK